MKKLLLGLFTAVFVLNYAAKAEVPNPLNVGIISTESSTVLSKNWTTFINDLSAYLKVDVKPFFAADYAGIIEGMRFGKVHVAWFGNTRCYQRRADICVRPSSSCDQSSKFRYDPSRSSTLRRQCEPLRAHLANPHAVASFACSSFDRWP